MSEVKEVRLGDVLKVHHGFAFKSSEFSDDLSYPTIVTPGNFSIGGGFREAKPKTFSGDFPPCYELAPGDLVITMTDLSKQGDTLGMPAVIPSDRRYLHNQRIGLVEVLEPNEVSKFFLAYYLRTRVYKEYVLGTASGSTVRHTSPSRIEDFVAHLPKINTQHAIAEVLGALDDKIAANNRLVAQSDELSQAIFRSSLIGDNQMLPLSSIADFVNGKAFTKNASGTGRVVIRIAEMNSGIGNSTVFNDIEVDEKHIARPGDILFAWSGSLTLQRWFRPEGIVNQHIFKVIARDGNPNWLVYELLRDKLDYYKRVAANKATTMGHIQRKDLDELVPVPDDSSLTRISAQMTALWNKMLNTEQENLQLAATRDALLPQLMSGKIRVRDAEVVVEDTL